MRAAGNYCECPTPCTADAYVPTTSFSVVLNGEANTQDEQTSQLQKKLSDARETAYRVVREKYTETMRSFHVIHQQLSRMIKFTKAMEEEMTSQHDQVSTHVVMVKV